MSSSDNYTYMYQVTPAGFVNGKQTFSIDPGLAAKDVDAYHGAQTEITPGETVNIKDASNGLNGSYDYLGSVTYTNHGTTDTGYIVYDAADQHYYMLTDDKFNFSHHAARSLGSLDSSGSGSDMPVCFLAGTQISTPSGGVNVETLKLGDLVLTADGRSAPVRWVGRQTVAKLFADKRSLPVRIKAGAVAENVPARDLLISHDHALFIDSVLVHAGALINGTSVVRERDVPSKFVYYHVEVDDHSLILAENTPAETFIDNVERARFDNWDEYEALYPTGKEVAEMPYPRAKARRQVPARLRSQLDARAEALGYAIKVAAAQRVHDSARFISVR